MGNRIIVAGGANIDICGMPDQFLREYDSNPGKISFAFGGVGRNIAQVCALLGRPVLFVTCFSSDMYGKQLREDCMDLGMDCRYSMTVDDMPSSVYLAVLDENGEMRLALNDMRILQRLTAEKLRFMPELAKPDDILVTDANLEEETIGYLLENCKCITAADPVSVSKCERLVPVLHRLTVFKPNRYEAEAISGIMIRDDRTAAECLDWFRQRGVRETIISLGAEGVLVGTEERKSWFRHRPAAAGNITGAGDAFLGAYLSARLESASVHDAAAAGIASAVITIENDAVRGRSLSSTIIRDRIAEMNIKETVLCW